MATNGSEDSEVDIVAVGESMLTIFGDHQKHSWLRWDVGGAESNVLRYCAGLGHSTRFVSKLGTGLAGSFVSEVITRDGVDISYVEHSDTHPTGLMLKNPNGVRYYRSGSAASTMSPGTVDLGVCQNASVVHLTGITLALSAGCRDLVMRLLDTTDGAICSFDVNWRQALWQDDAGDVLLEAANRADVVFVGLDEANAVWGVSTPEAVRELLPDPHQVIIKDGAIGAYAAIDGSMSFQPALKGTVVDPMGAGDAFAAGYLSGLLTNPQDSSRCLRLGHLLAGTSVMSKHDVGILPDPAVIERMLTLSNERWGDHVWSDMGSPP